MPLNMLNIKQMDNTPFHILKPGPDWPLNLLINDISRSIDKDEFERLKMLFRCDKLFGKKVLEQMNTAFDMFTLMKERMMINCNDIVWLQAALYHIERVDLLQKCVHYAKESSDCLHFFSPTFQPENGFKFVKIHLAGPDMKKKTKRVIDDLKTTIKILLGIPTNFICIVGVEPTESLLITVMMPDMYVDWLQSVLEAEEHIIDPYNLRIDMIGIRGRIYNVQCTSAEVEMDMQKHQQGDFHIDSQFKDYEEIKYQRDEIEKKMLIALKQLKIQEKHVGEIADTVQKAFRNTADDLSTQRGREKTLHVFSELLQVCCVREYDVRLIQRLLTVHFGIIHSEMTIQSHCKEAELVIKLHSLEAQILPLQRRLLMCQKLHNGMQTIPDKVQIMQQVSVAFSFNIREEVLSVLREICDELTDKDMETIRERYTWNPDENATKLAKTQEEFLHGVVEKEITDRNAVLNGKELESFLFGLFDLIGKEGLKEKFQRLMKAQETSLQTSDRRLLLEINKKMTDLHSAFQGKIPSEVSMFNEKILDYTAASNPIQYHSPGSNSA